MKNINMFFFAIALVLFSAGNSFSADNGHAKQTSIPMNDQQVKETFGESREEITDRLLKDVAAKAKASHDKIEKMTPEEKAALHQRTLDLNDQILSGDYHDVAPPANRKAYLEEKAARAAAANPAAAVVTPAGTVVAPPVVAPAPDTENASSDWHKDVDPKLYNSNSNTQLPVGYDH